MTRIRRARHTARRLSQTTRDFDNGWQILASLARKSPELRFDIDGLTIFAPNAPGARVPVYELFIEDEYNLNSFTEGLSDAPVVLDIGAHIGCFAVSFATRFPGARVYSYEPTPSTGEYLSRNVSTNGLDARITVNKEAVAAETGSLTIADNGPGSGHNGVLHLGKEGTVGIEVPARSIADAFAAAGDVEFVKLDTEGAEYEIIGNGPEGLWSSVRRLVMEYHPVPGHTFEELDERLTAEGLTLIDRVHAPSGLGLAWFSRV